MKFSEVRIGEYLKAHELGDGDRPVTIESWELFEEKGEGKYPERSIILRFREFPDKKLTLNKINGDAITGMYGEETEDWPGKRITLYATEVQNPQGKTVMGIRVRLRPPPAVSASSPSAGSGPVMGDAGAAKLMTRLNEKKLAAGDLVKHLIGIGKPRAVVSDDVSRWPAEWGPNIKDWLENPVKAPGPSEDNSIKEEDIPFDSAPA